MRLPQETSDSLSDGRHLGRRAHPVGTTVKNASFNLPLQTGDSDHEKLIQIRAKDREELNPFQHRDRFVLCFLQYPSLELQHAEFTIHVQLGRVERRDLEY
jgi:hypothetical protein